MTRLVYIVGSSYSGSTLLGILLGQDRAYFNAGELKALGRDTTAMEICSCDNTISNCPFWSTLLPLTENTTSLPNAANWISTILSLFFHKRSNNRQPGHDRKLIDAIAARTFEKPESGFVVDVSKSLWRLDKLLLDARLEVKTVWIRKSLPASIGSLMKRGRGYWFALFQASLTDWASRRFMERRAPGYATIWYEDLATDTDDVLTKLAVNIGVFQDAAKERNRPYDELHLSTGNNRTKSDLSAGRKISVKLDPSWQQRLSKRQRKIALYLARKLNHPYQVYTDA